MLRRKHNDILVRIHQSTVSEQIAQQTDGHDGASEHENGHLSAVPPHVHVGRRGGKRSGNPLGLGHHRCGAGG
jgi:hypothetical protein